MGRERQTPPACGGLEIVRSRLVAVVRRDHPFAKKQALSLSELSGMTVFILDKTHEMTRMFQKNYPKLFATRNLSYSSNEYEDFCQLSRYLDGVALTFRFLCGSLPQDLVTVPVRDESCVSLRFCMP